MSEAPELEARNRPLHLTLPHYLNLPDGCSCCSSGVQACSSESHGFDPGALFGIPSIKNLLIPAFGFALKS